MRLSAARIVQFALLVAAATGAPEPSRAQSSTEIIRGRVIGPDSQPLPSADIMVTGLANQIVQRTRTDQRGAFTVLFTNPEADYVIAVRKIGYLATTQRLSRTGISNVLGVEIQLRTGARMLDTVLVGSNDDAVRRAAGEASTSDLAEQMFLADPSNLMQLLLSIPGAGILFDSSGAQSISTTTLDGANFRGRELPPDALASARGIGATADPAKGGFSGGSVSTTLRGGTDIFSATVRGSMTDPSTMAWNDPAWTRPLQSVYDNSGTASGPVIKGKLRYNVSWRAADRSTDWFSLAAPRTDVLSQQGIVIDTVRAVSSTLGGLGVPTASAAIPRRLDSRSLAITNVWDYTPSATTSVRLSYNGNFQDAVNGASTVTAFPTRANGTGFEAQFASVKASTFLFGLLDEVTASYNSYYDHTDPYLTLPAATVRVGTDFGDGRTGFTNLSFGGGTGASFERYTGLELINEISWLPKDGSHKVKIGGRLNPERNEYYSFDDSPLNGRYTYLSTADLLANRPATYERLLNTQSRKAAGLNASAWVGDEWALSRSWQLQGGLRFDFANPDTRPAYNQAVDSLFGVRTDRIPRDVGMSPRLGFSWASKARLGKAGGASSLGGMSAQQVMNMSPDLVRSLLDMERSGASTLPGIGVSGTIGAFRGVTSNSQVADYIQASGVGTRVLLQCVGDAVPVPDWRQPSGPSRCANGSGPQNSIESPLVKVFAPDYHPINSWRANLTVDGIRVPNQWIIKLTASGNYSTQLQSNVDLNLVHQPRFYLAAEGNRPVYVDATAIFPETGTASQAASRISPQFTTVTQTVSDLRSYNWQMQASIGPPRPLFGERVQVQLSYALTHGEGEQRGSSRIGITGDPFTKEWVRNNQPTHQLRATINSRFWWLNTGVQMTLLSGIPFTPRVVGDVNGDGDATNDRAFIPDPATLTDTTLARQLRDLMASAPSAARSCIASQLGRMAGGDACYTPWQFRMDVTASLTPPSTWGYSDRLRLTFATQNASGGLVRLFGLQNTPLGQSSLSTTPNSTLLYVTGFDPVKQQYVYRVNELFGQPTNYGSLRQRFPPMQVQVGLEYKFGGPTLNPVARAMGFREADGQAPLSEAQRRAAVAKLKKDPVAPLLRVRDSLGLSDVQVSDLRAVSAAYNAKADAALRELTEWIVDKGTRIFDVDLSPRLAEARAALAKLQPEYDKRAKAVLTSAQSARAGTLTREK